MKFEFILKVKYHPSAPWTQVGRSVVKEEDFNNAKKSFEDYEKRYVDTLVLINKLDDDGDFLEVVQ